MQTTNKSITALLKTLTAKAFINELLRFQSDHELEKIKRYFKSGKGEYSEGDKFIGVRMGDIFNLAKQYMHMPPAQIEKLLDHNTHEVRVGAVSIMDFQARDKKTSNERKKELFELYTRRHDRINNWDLVDRAAAWVVGAYAFENPGNSLIKLARSANMWERRTAIVASSFFIKKGDTSHTFQIAALLINDKEDLLHKAAGGWVREAGKHSPEELKNFLDKYAAQMPRVMLRYAIEHLTAVQKQYYLHLK